MIKNKQKAANTAIKKRAERPLTAAQKHKLENLREKIRERSRQLNMLPTDMEIRYV